MTRIVLSCLIIWASSGFVLSQECSVHYEGSHDEVLLFQRHIKNNIYGCDTTLLVRALRQATVLLNAEGYLEAGFSLSVKTDGNLNCIVSTGKLYKWKLLKARGSKQLQGSFDGTLKYKDLQQHLLDYLSFQENNGFPFAQVYLDSIQLANQNVSAVIRDVPGPYVTLDTLRISGAKIIKQEWLMAYLNLMPGGAFSQKKINQISQRINELGFVEQAQPYEIVFQNNEALITLYLREKKINNVNGIIGFLPNEQNGKLLVTGEFEMGLRNLFQTGKKLDVKWQSLKARSQFLDMTYHHPNLFFSAVDLGAGFSLLKEDSLFVNRSIVLDLSYKKQNSLLGFFADFKTSGLLTTDGNQISELPASIDFSLDNYGFSYKFNSTNNGSSASAVNLMLSSAVGVKRIRRNQNISPVIYESLNPTSTQYDLKASFNHSFRLTNRVSLYYNLSGAKLLNGQLFLNDLYRIGGLKSIRGFNENFFFAEEYAFSNLEARFYIQPESFISIFWDQAYLHYKLSTASSTDYPSGLGLGLNLPTDAGVLKLAYALGRSNEQDFSFALSRFHFGYVAKF